MSPDPRDTPGEPGPQPTLPSPHRAPRASKEPGLDPRQSGEMPFLRHLEELRSVITHSVIAVAVGTIAGWMVAPRVLEDVVKRTVGHAVVLSPLEAFNERFKLAMILGVTLVLPYVFFRLWSFVVPGLLKRERSLILPMAFASMLLFALGAWAAYGYVTPLVIRVLATFMTPSMVAEIRLSSILGFVYNLAIACGLMFQLPLVCMALTALGLVTPAALLKQWRIAIVVVFFVTAVVTPGDVVTAQIIMGIPMVGLYFLSVGLSWMVARRGRESERGPAEEEVESA